MSKLLPKVGILSGGGDCPGINTVIDSFTKYLEDKFEILGFYRGMEGLYQKDYITLNSQKTNSYKFTGGTFLKSVNEGHFSAKVGYGKKEELSSEVLAVTKKNYKDLGLSGLVVIGGDGTLSATENLQRDGLNVIGIPKSIDNDLAGTLFSFGFLTSIDIASNALDRLETTAYSHDRIMILEVMGRHTGWIALYSGVSGGANVILIPEIPFQFKKVVEFLRNRGKKNSLIVVAEGSLEHGGEKIGSGLGEKSSEVVYGGIGDKLAKMFNQTTEFQARCTRLGHIQRGGTPNSFDRILSRQFGVEAAQALIDGDFGKMIAYNGQEFVRKPLNECIQNLKSVDLNSSLVQNAERMGIYLGK